MRNIFLSVILGFLISQTAGCQWIHYAWKNTVGVQTTLVTSGIEDQNSRLWFGTNKGLDSFNPDLNLWTHYTTVDGLADNYINRLYCDRDGIIWVATDFGLSRFSDNRFTNFSSGDGLSSDLVRSITQSPDGTLYFGTFEGGVNSYTPESGFNRLPLSGKDSCILSLLALSDTSILIGTFNRGLVLFQNDSAYSINNPNELQGKIIYSLFRDQTGEIWVGTDQGAQKYDQAQNRILPGEDSLSNNIVYAIIENDSNELVFGTYSKIYKFGEGTWSSFVPDDIVKPTSYFSLMYDSKGTFWAGTSSQGLHYLTGDTWENSSSLGPHDIAFLSICEGKDHMMWFASNNNLYSYDGSTWNQVAVPDGNGGIQKIASDTSGTIWCLRDSWEVYSYDGRSWKAHTGPADFDGANVSALASDLYGNVWFAACNSGVFRFDGKSWSHFIDYSLMDYDAPNLFCYNHLAFYPDGKLITTDYNAMLSFFDGTGWTSSDLIKGQYGIYDMTIAPDNSAWLGTNNGIIKYKDGRIESLFTGEPFVSIQVDPSGHIWAADSWIGLKWSDGENWYTITTDDGLSSNWISDIFFDSRGRTWLATQNGINLSDNVTGIPGNKEELSGIVALPNPFSYFLQLQYYSDEPGDAVIQFISQDGRIIQQVSEPLQKGLNEFQFNTAQWPDGMAICIITSDGKTFRQKLMKISDY